MTASLLAGLDLDLQWRLVRRLVVNLERRVVQAESLLDELLQHAAPVVAVVARPYDDIARFEAAAERVLAGLAPRDAGAQRR